MTTIKAFNVIHQGRKNQNTTYFFVDRDYGYTSETPDETIINELHIHKPINVSLQKNSYCKILERN